MFYHAGTVIFSNGFLYIFQSDPMSVCFLSISSLSDYYNTDRPR